MEQDKSGQPLTRLGTSNEATSFMPEVSPRSSRLPGMHGGHDLLLGLLVAVALFATLVLYAAHS